MPDDTPDLMCYACGPQNPAGLKLVFGRLASGRFGTSFTPKPEHQGYKDIVHGGFLALVLDETMVAELFDAGVHAASAEITVRLLKPIAPGEALTVTAYHEEPSARRVVAHAEARRDGDDALVARARAVCVRVDGAQFHAAGHAGADGRGGPTGA